MRDLSLHLLDLIENSTRAGTSVVAISIEQDRARDLMTVSIEDDGPGLAAPPEQATDPFYTTKPNKRVGLGLSLFAAAAERAGGRVDTGQSPLGGLALRATMRLGHVDRAPMGDIGSTLATAICSNGGVDFRVSLSVDGRLFAVSSAATAARMPPPNDSAFMVARQVATEIRNAMDRLKFIE